MRKSTYIAFFDLDGTILSSNSGKILVRSAYQAGLMKKKEVVYGIYLSLLNRFNLKNPARIIEKMAKWVEGLPENLLVDFSNKIFDQYLRSSIYSEIQSEIEFHKKRQARIVILSSAVHSICLPVAHFLDMDDIISSKLEVVDGVYTGYPSGNFCFGDEKLYRLRDYCEIYQCLPVDAYYYGDSISDLPVLDGVGNPVCVNPDKKLKRVARINNWDIRNWH